MTVAPDPALAALITGLTTNGMAHGMSANYARHVLEVLRDAGFAVLELPEPVDLATSSIGVRSARFGSVTASVYPAAGGWLISENGAITWDEFGEADAETTAAGILAALRWVKQEASKQ